MHITVTGSHGFIGTHLRQHLEAQGHIVECWDLLIQKDIANFTIDPDSDLCIHLAAKADIRESFDNPEKILIMPKVTRQSSFILDGETISHVFFQCFQNGCHHKMVMKLQS